MGHPPESLAPHASVCLFPKHVTAPNRNIPSTSNAPSLAVGKLVLFGDYPPKPTMKQYCQFPPGPYSQWQNWTDNLQLMYLLWRQDTGIFTNRSFKPQSRVKTHGEKYILLLFPCWLWHSLWPGSTTVEDCKFCSCSSGCCLIFVFCFSGSFYQNIWMGSKGKKKSWLERVSPALFTNFALSSEPQK